MISLIIPNVCWTFFSLIFFFLRLKSSKMALPEVSSYCQSSKDSATGTCFGSLFIVDYWVVLSSISGSLRTNIALKEFISPSPTATFYNLRRFLYSASDLGLSYLTIFLRLIFFSVFWFVGLTEGVEIDFLDDALFNGGNNGLS